MKKFAISAAAVAVVCMLAVPAMAVEFTPYMSVRMHTDFVDTDGDTDLNWDLAGNTRLGGHFKTDTLGGRFEFGVKDGVGTRLMYGTYKMGEMGTLLVGQTYNPYTQFSGQALQGDQGNIGFGTAYDGRKPQIKLSMPMGLSIALIEPSASGVGGGDVDTFLPKIAVAYDLKTDMVKAGLSAAVNVAQQNKNAALSDDENIVSGLIAAKLGANAGPAELKAQLYFGQNLTNFGIIQLPGGGAVADGGDIENTTNFGGWLQARFDTGMAKVTAGVGYTSADNDTYKDPDTQATYWVNANIPIAKGFFVVPEFSYFDFMDNAAGVEEDDKWRLGAKWQMNL